ncbi:MAG: hypothetical protein WC055_00655 [Melioribacteraceae bacterium]
MPPKKKDKLSALAGEIKDNIDAPVEVDVESIFDNGTISTGSTLLDLEISGSRIRGGGIPSGVIVEIFGPSGAGKTSILAEICANAKAKGGDFKIADPEARLDAEYAKIYGLKIDKTRYFRPDTVPEMFSAVWDWEPKPEKQGAISVFAGDSLAALSTSMELEDDTGDKMGMRRAKEFSEWMRKTCRKIAGSNTIVVLTNQERESPTGVTTPGGKAIPYYASLRIRVSPQMSNKYIKSTKKVGSQTIEKKKGIRSKAQIKKSSIGDPHGECPYSIVFGYGLDDMRENLQYLKEVNGESKYVVGDQEFSSVEKAIIYAEQNDSQNEIKEKVIDRWEEIQASFVTEERVMKRR